MPWLTAKRQTSKPRLRSLPSLAMVAVSGLTGGAALAALEKQLQQQGLQPFLLPLLAVPGIVALAVSVALAVAHLTPSTRLSRRPSVP